MNRKLIRPSLTDIKDQLPRGQIKKRLSPPEQTNAETFYYLKQMQSRTPMVIALDGGEVVRGIIEWYDRDCIKVNRTQEPNLLIMKRSIRYMFKEGENGTAPSSEESKEYAYQEN